MKWHIPPSRCAGLYLLCCLGALGWALFSQVPFENFIVLWLLAVGMGFTVLTVKPPPVGWFDRALAGSLLFLALLLALVKINRPDFPANWAGAVGVLSMLCAAGGRKCAAKLTVGVLLLCVLAPKQEYLFWCLSYPLRLVCTTLTVSLLQLFGVVISHDLTVITIGDSQVAITAACSGIEQLEALLLIGWLLVMLLHKTFWMRLSHYLMLLPVIILTNTARLVVTLLLYLRFGNWAFNNTVHTMLGFGMVIASLLLLWGLGGIFKLGEPAPKSKEQP